MHLRHFVSMSNLISAIGILIFLLESAERN